MIVLPATWTDGAAVVADRANARLSAQPVGLGRKVGKLQLNASVGAAGWRTSMKSVEDMWCEAFRDLLERREHGNKRFTLVASL
jgi:hypothetical protein